MKLRYLFSMIIASVLLLAGCVKEEATDSFANIQLDKTYLSIPATGGSATLKVNATEAWAIDSEIPEWMKIDNVEGAAGETTVTISAEAVSGGREAELSIKAGVSKQFFRVRQGSLQAESATCADVIAGPDGKTYRVKGTVTSISNTTYGNWYLKDDTGEVYIYGTLDKDGKTKNFASLGLEVGDVVEVEGPKTTYGTTVELVDVTVLSIEKALLKIITPEPTLEAEGGDFTVKVAYKGKGLFPAVSEDAQDWMSIVSTETKYGEPTKIEPNPADTAFVKVKVAEFTEYEPKRTGTIIFSSSMKNDDDKIVSTETVFTVTQTGLVIPTIADVLEAGETTSAKTQGVIVAKYNRGALISDGTGYILVYKNAAIEEVVGDKIEVNGPTSKYGGMLQFTKDAVITKISSDNAVIHPEPTVLDGAGMDAQLAKASVEYIEYVGTLAVSGTYYNVTIEGASTAIGSLQYIDPAAFPKAVDGAKIKVRGYFIGVSSDKYVNTMTVAVVDPEEEIEGPSLPTIAQVIAAGAQEEATTQGVIVAKYNRGALIYDGTAYILVYKKAEITEAIGDKIMVTGPVSQYAGMYQFGEATTVTKISNGNEVVAPTPAVLDGAGMDAQLAKTAVEYVQYTGTLAISGTYYNVTVDGASTAIGSLSYPNADAFPALVDGAKITVKGYFIGVSSSKYVNTMVVSVEAAEAAPAVDPWETAAVTVNGAEAEKDARLKELRAYADADYLYVRLTATKETPFNANYLDFFFTDGEGETAVWWGWTTTGTDIYYQEHKCELDENGNLTKMRWYPVEGDRVYIDDYTTEISDSEVVWTMKFPRSYVDVYKSSTNTVRMSFLLWNGWDAYWAIPARGGEMMEVTLP